VRRTLALVGALLGVGVAVPTAASAHGIFAKQDLPIPSWMFAWAAAIVLVVSFVALAVLWPEPRFTVSREKVVAKVPAVLDVLCGLLGLSAFGFVVYAGFAGSQSSLANILPTTVFVVFWVGLPLLSVLVGDVFRAINPWRALARGTAWVAGRVSGPGGLPAPQPYPEWLGRWPAVATIVGFGWLELVYVDRDDPSTLAALALVYAAIQLVAMSVWGIEEWTSRGDGFSVAFNLFARLAPLDWRGGRLVRRPPLEGVIAMSAVPGTVWLVCAMIGTTAFDGFSSGSVWVSLEPHVQRAFANLGFGPDAAVETAYTLGLALVVGAVAGLYRLGVVGMRSVGGGHTARELSGRFAHTLVPIAYAYVLAHYFSLFVFSGQAMFYLVSDPLGTGANYFGTATTAIDYSLVSPTGIWYVQVAALVVGHVCAVTLAHERALTIYRQPRRAVRSQYWMLLVMVGFTCLGLWLLSQ
jgi:hypothetical protein